MANNTDERVLSIIKELIKEVKEEMSTKKVLAEGKQPEQVFNKHQADMKRYISQNVIKALREAEE